jgi:hypothetical protein
VQLVRLHREPFPVLRGGVDISPSGLRFEGRGDRTPGIAIRSASLGGSCSDDEIETAYRTENQRYGASYVDPPFAADA